MPTLMITKKRHSPRAAPNFSSQLWFVFSEYVCRPWSWPDHSDLEGPQAREDQKVFEGATPIFFFFSDGRLSVKVWSRPYVQNHETSRKQLPNMEKTRRQRSRLRRYASVGLSLLILCCRLAAAAVSTWPFQVGRVISLASDSWNAEFLSGV